MKNPWESLRFVHDSYVLETDLTCIEQFNNRQQDKDRRVAVGAIPEPFIGHPSLAKLVLLGLNPGHSDSNWSHRDPDFQKAMFRNLQHQTQDFPFYPLNPSFAETGAGRWWGPMVRQLRTESGLGGATFSQRLMVIEWFPYASKRSGLPHKQICESQEYSFDLAKSMLRREGVVVLGMRSRAHWMAVSSEFCCVPFLINRQRPFISRGNMECTLFERILEALRSPQ